jgi:pimeloyl-ACP methyl ester carboxylesterase
LTHHGERSESFDAPPKECPRDAARTAGHHGRPSAGEDDLPLLLIHGHSSRLEEYDAILPHVGGRRRVLIPDLPGSGYSDKPDRRYDLRFLEDSLLGFLDANGITECHVGGGSLGANLALRLGHREPERFRHLAAWAPAGAWDPMHAVPALMSVVKHLRFLFWPTLRLQSRYWYSKRWSGRHIALIDAWKYYREVYSRGFHRMYWDIGAAQLVSTLFDRAAEIEHPTYLAYGDEDRGLDLDIGTQRLATLMKRAKLRCFVGARHSLANEIPEALGREVDAFLADPLA